MENWKPIPGYEGLYEVSDLGNVRSLHQKFKAKSIVILKQATGSRGYKLVTLCKDQKQTSFNVHRIVANVFVPNPNNYPCVNHIDEDKTNNSASNLEWCSYYYNNVYGERLTKSALKRSKPVMCIETGVIYASTCAAQRETGVCQSHISACCRGKRKTAGKLHWKFIDKELC